MLTVQETLTLIASLKAVNSGLEVSQLSIESAVNDTIHLLGLAAVADSLVGVGGINDHVKKKSRPVKNRRVKGSSKSYQYRSSKGSVRISGGERKRLAIGCELVTCERSSTCSPLHNHHQLQSDSNEEAVRLLVADEPTSGLDSHQALRVVRVLKEVSRLRGVATVCTLHQPRSSIFELFDSLLLLTPLGRPAFYGPREAALPYFAALGYECPFLTNPAEFLIDLVSLDLDSREGLAASKKRVRGLVEAFEASQAPLKAVSIPLRSHARPSRWRSPLRLCVASVGRFGLLLRRALTQVLRDSAVNTDRMAVYASLALLVGNVYGPATLIKAGFTAESVSNRVNVIANAAINVAMLSMIKTLQVYQRERVVVDRERPQGLYSAGKYLLAKACAELPGDALAAAVFGALLHRQAGLHCHMDRFVLVLSLLSGTCSSLGLALGALFKGDVALAAGPALMVMYVVVGSVGPAGSGGRCGR